MKRTLVTLGIIGLVCFLLVFRLFYRQHNQFIEERKWFAREVGYEFSATVDSISMLNPHTGRLHCLLTQGDPRVYREDSLKPYFRFHDMLYLIYIRSADSLTFMVPNADLLAEGDSVRVSSAANSIVFFRNKTPVATDELSETLTGFGRPFFARKKK